MTQRPSQSTRSRGLASVVNSDSDNSPQDSPRLLQLSEEVCPESHGSNQAEHHAKCPTVDVVTTLQEPQSHNGDFPEVSQAQHIASRAPHIFENGDHAKDDLHQNGTAQSRQQSQSERPAQSDCSVHVIQHRTFETTTARTEQRQPSASGSRPSDGWSYPRDDKEVIATGTVTSKRNRKFGKRTRTGCVTCRLRKKKCDEGRPVCKRCLQGGFDCKGYRRSRRVTPTKLPPVKFFVPHGPDGAQSIMAGHQTDQDPQPEVHSSRLPIHPSNDPGRHGPADDDIHGQSWNGSSLRRIAPHSQQPISQQHPSQQGQNSSVSKDLHPYTTITGSESPQRPDLQDASEVMNQGHAQHPPQHTALQSLAPDRYSYSASLRQSQEQWLEPQQHTYSLSSYSPSRKCPGSEGTPRLSSQSFKHNTISFKVSSQEDVEKSKMLRSSQYNHFDPTLLHERQRCERAVERYNSARKLDSGLTEQEVYNLLVKVVDPSQDTTHKFPVHNHGKGHIGVGVTIESSFSCTYGYNLRLLDDVCVGRGSTFDDAGTIEIGSRTTIGPGVTILTNDYSKDLVHRKGTRGYWIAKDVYIASGVVIGAGVVIYPGVMIGEGVIVEPGAVVCGSLKAGQILRASPSQIINPTQH